MRVFRLTAGTTCLGVSILIAYTGARVDDSADARTIVQQAARIASSIPTGPDSDALDWLGLALAQAKSDDPAAAMTSAARIRDPEYARFTWRAIATFQADNGHVAGALQTAARIENDPEKATLMSELAVAQAHAGDRAGAVRTLTQALNETASDEYLTLLAIAGAQAAIGDLDGARRTAARIAGDIPRDVAVKRIAVAQAKRGDPSGAQQTAGSISDGPSRSMAMRGIAEAMARSNDVRGALTIAAGMPPGVAKAIALRRIALVEFRSGDPAGALATLTQAFQATASIQDSADAKRVVGTEFADDLTSQPLLFVPIAVFAGHPGAFADAMWPSRKNPWYADFVTAFVRVSFLKIAVAQIEAGDRAAARRTLDHVVKSALALEDSENKARALIDIGIGLAAAGIRVDSANTLTQALTIARVQKLDYVNRIVLEDDISAAQTRAGDFEGAGRTATAIRSTADRDLALRGLAIAQAENGDVSGAIKTAGQISGNVVQSLLPELAHARARAGGAADAARLAAGQPSSTKVAILVGVAYGMLDRRDVKRLQARNE